VDKDIFGGTSRFAKIKTLNYDMGSLEKFFTILVLGSVSCNSAAVEKT
jgi:hypothetical protein